MVFNELSLPNKAEIVREWGVRLNSLQSNNHWVYLYSLGRHFVEVFYDLSTHRIDNIVLISYKDVDKYTDQIVQLVYK